MNTTKRCSKCGKVKPISEFNKRKDRKIGITSVCKLCNARQCREYEMRNKDQLRDKRHSRYWQDPQKARNRKNAWRASHREQVKEREHNRYWANPQHYRNKANRYTRKHREDHTRRAKQWRQRNPLQIRAYAAHRRAMARRAEGKYTSIEITAQYKRQRGKCYYCECALNGTYHIDHVVPLSRGGSNNIDNLVLACPTCNIKKKDKLPHEWSEGGRLL